MLTKEMRRRLADMPMVELADMLRAIGQAVAVSAHDLHTGDLLRSKLCAIAQEVQCVPEMANNFKPGLAAQSPFVPVHRTDTSGVLEDAHSAARLARKYAAKLGRSVDSIIDSLLHNVRMPGADTESFTRCLEDLADSLKTEWKAQE